MWKSKLGLVLKRATPTYFRVLNGDNDNQIIGCVKFTSLNQLENANHHDATVSITAQNQMFANARFHGYHKLLSLL